MTERKAFITMFEAIKILLLELLIGVLLFLLGWIFVRTHSLLFCIICHAFNNSIGYILELLHISISGYTMEGFQPVWFTFFGFMFLLIGFIILKSQGFFITEYVQLLEGPIEIDMDEMGIGN